MDQTKIGIGDIGLYLPSPRMRMDTLVKSRAVSHPELVNHLSKAIKKTGLTAFRFPEPWEDTASLAGNAAVVVLDRMTPAQVRGIRSIVTGTETAVDHSKPVSAYVQGMLQNANYDIASNLSTFEVKHACAGGTAALLSSSSMLGFSGNPDDRALILCSDISRYEAPSAAEMTQGAGSAALLIEKNPRLLEIDLRNQGYFSSDVDDFFRPPGSVTARVKGGYSMKCYRDALIAAYSDYCNRLQKSPQEVLDDTDYIALHVPFPTMPEVAVTQLLDSVYGKNTSRMEEFISKTCFMDAMYLNRETGNLYTVSLYAYLAALLEQEWKKHKEAITGKSILVASYGSGNTMFVFSMTIAEGAPEMISRWRIKEALQTYHEADFHEYLNWLARPEDFTVWKNLLEGAMPAKGMFYLKDFTTTGFRLYDRA